MSKIITSTSLMSVFPHSLARDPDKEALAKSASQELQSLIEDNDRLAIYTAINKLPEDLCDVLADDFKVDWYLANGTLETKRAQIASCFDVHRHLGTKAALVYALSDICPGTDIQEWFEYGGLPYYFRIILDVTEQRLPISHDIVTGIVNVVKSLRSVLEDDSIIYRCHNIVRLGLTCGYVPFSARLCGTYPSAAVQGEIDNTSLNIGSGEGSAAFVARTCGRPLGAVI